MKFLTDENVAKSVLKALRKEGYDVKDIKEEGLLGISDKNIISIAKKEDRIIITHDKDFANQTMFPLKMHKGVVLLKFRNQSPAHIIANFIPKLNAELKKKMKHSLVTITDTYTKIDKMS